MSTYTKKRRLSSVEKKAFEKKQFLNLATYWQENRFSLMRSHLKNNPMEFDYIPASLKKSLTDKTKAYEHALLMANKRILAATSYLVPRELELENLEKEIKSLKLKKTQILEAKLFLRLVGLLHAGYTIRSFKDSDLFSKKLNGLSWKDLRNELAEIRENTTNEYLKIACTVLSLPPSVFREILWRKNVDFDSFESFLRRLKPEQIEAIYKADYEFFELGMIPSIFSEDKLLRRLFKKQRTYDELWNQEIDFDEKYLSKGAWSYDLFNMDFGYGRYPNGLSDDTEETERDISRFISIKNHVNDFVVNKRDGIYFWLYKKARSNYVYRPNRDVKMSTHICPGFWYTLIMHLMFWVVSPAAIVYLQFAKLELSFSFVTIVALASFTWVLVGAALFKFLLLSLGEAVIWLIEKYEAKQNSITQEEKYRQTERREKIAKLAKKVGAVLKDVGFVFFIIAVIVVALAFLIACISAVFLASNEWFSLPKSIFITSVVAYFSAYLLWYKYEFDYSPSFHKWPKYIKILLFSTLAYILADVVQYFSADILRHSSVNIFPFFVSLKPLFYVLAFTAFAYFGLSKLLSYLDKRSYENFTIEYSKDTQKDSKSTLSWKFYEVIGYTFYFSIIAFWLTGLTYALYMFSHLIAYFALVLLSLISFVLGTSYVSKKLLILSPKARRLKNTMGFALSGYGEADKYLFHNTYVNSLSDDEQVALRKRIHNSIMSLCNSVAMNHSYESIETKIYKHLDSETKMNRFFNLVKFLGHFLKNRDSYENTLFINKVFDLLATDLSVKKIKEALKSIRDKGGLIPVKVIKQKQKSKFKQNWLAIKTSISEAWDKFVDSSFVSGIGIILLYAYKAFSFVFIGLWKILSFLPKTFWKYIRQLWSTYKIFMNACPHVATQRSLR